MPGLTHEMNSSPTLVVDSTESSKRTNTLVLTQLPIPFFHPRVMDALRNHFALHGRIRAWAPLRTFARVIVVYESEDSADDAKMYCDGLQIDGTPETYVLLLTPPPPFFFSFWLTTPQPTICPQSFSRRPNSADATRWFTSPSTGDRKKFLDFATRFATGRLGTGGRRSTECRAPR
jgi:Calcipressin